MGIGRRVSGVVIVGAILVAVGIAACGDDPTPVTGCTPGASSACVGTGQCAGTQLCKSDRTFDACVCGNPILDGGTEAGGDGAIVDAGPDVDPFDPTPLTWAEFMESRALYSIAVDPQHAILIGGGGQDAVSLSKLDPKGKLIWDKSFSANGSYYSYATVVTSDPSGNVYAVYYSLPGTNFGGGVIAQEGRVVVKFDANGVYQWHYGPFPVAATFNRLATRSNGNLVIAGAFAGSINFGTGTLSSNLAQDALVIELTPSKAVVKIRQFGDSGNQEIYGLALDAAGNAYVAGDFNGTIDFGKGPMTGPPAGGSQSNPRSVFLAKLDSNLNGVVQKDGAATGTGDYLSEVTVDPKGNVGLGGVVATSIKFGATAVVATTPRDLYFAYFDASLGEIWSKRYGGNTGEDLSGIAPRPAGGFAATGFSNGDLDFGIGGLPLGAQAFFYTVQFDMTGNPVSNFGSTSPGGTVGGKGIAYLGGTDFVMIGNCGGGKATLPSGPLNCINTSGAFAARLLP